MHVKNWLCSHTVGIDNSVDVSDKVREFQGTVYWVIFDKKIINCISFTVH